MLQEQRERPVSFIRLRSEQTRMLQEQRERERPVTFIRLRSEQTRMLQEQRERETCNFH